MKKFLSIFNREKITGDKTQTIISLLLIVFVFLYQLIKSKISFNYDNTLGLLININPLADISFVILSITLIVLTPKIVRLTNKKIIIAVIICCSLLISASYTYLRNLDWIQTQMDVPQDSFALANEAQEQGIPDFIATYNDRGNPGLPGSSPYATKVHDFLRSFGIEPMAQSYWVGKMQTNYGRPFMHPPTFFAVLAIWQSIFGNTQLIATTFMWVCTAIWGVICFLLLEAIQSKASVFLTILFITLPTSILDTWFPTYDVLSAMFLMLGYGLFILAASKKSNGLFLLSGLAMGTSVMFRLTTFYFAVLLPLALLYLIAKRQQPKKSIFLYLSGLSIFPIVLLISGYNPILTLVTAKFRQDNFYEERVFSLLKRLPVFLYLGIPLIVLVIFGILKRVKELFKSPIGLWILLPVLASIPVAITTRLTPDFHRNMIGICACFILVISLLENWPHSRIYQALLVGINLSFVLLVSLL